MSFVIRPRQYQDVKASLRWYTSFVVVGTGLLFYILVLPPLHKDALKTLFGSITAVPWVGPLFAVLIAEALGVLLIFIFEVHDKFYDRVITRWRFYYDIDFILPRLLMPLGSRVHPRFLKEAEKDRREFMKIYYHFVGDEPHSERIKENLLVHFYETVVKYWMTQINEVFLLVLLVFTGVYYSIYRGWNLDVHPVFVALIVFGSLLVLNRLGVRATRKAVRSATLDELEDIHKRFGEALDRQVAETHQNYNLPYGQSQH